MMCDLPHVLYCDESNASREDNNQTLKKEDIDYAEKLQQEANRKAIERRMRKNAEVENDVNEEEKGVTIEELFNDR